MKSSWRDLLLSRENPVWWYWGWPRQKKSHISEYIGFLRKLSDADTWNILGCPFLHIIEHGKIWKHVFQIRPLSTYWLLLLEPSSPGQGIATSSKKWLLNTSGCSTFAPPLSTTPWVLGKDFLPKLRACGPWAITSVTAVNLLQGMEADRLAATRDPQAGLQGHHLEIGMDLFNEVTELLTRN